MTGAAGAPRLIMELRFVIDAFPDSAARYRRGYAVVAIDVIRATSMAITAVAGGRRCFPAATLEAARRLAAGLPNPILAGEQSGRMPPGFDMNNSPAELAARTDVSRPLVMLSTSGTKLMNNAMGSDVVYLACFRNYSSVGRRLVAEGFPGVALLGAGSRVEFREEDQMCCAWVGAQLAREGYTPQDGKTAEIVERWEHATPSHCLVSRSVDYLRRSGQLADIDFILDRVDDLDDVFVLWNGEVMAQSHLVEVSVEAASSCA